MAEHHHDKANALDFPSQQQYVIDNRPLCQGMPFVLTDSAHPRYILKYGSHFLVLDQSGSIPACNTLGYGYYRYDTRHLSQYEVTIDGVPLSLLSSDVKKGYAGNFLYTNPQTETLPQQKIMLHRQIVMSDNVWERLSVENFHSDPISIRLMLKFQSDFADMFEVRGLNRMERGQRFLPTADKKRNRLYLAYRGLDGCMLETMIEFQNMSPIEMEDGEVVFHLDLPGKSSKWLEAVVHTRVDGKYAVATSDERDFKDALYASDTRYRLWRQSGCTVGTDHDIFNLCMERGFKDLYILRQSTPKGQGLAAGIPWYAAVFGRDSAITGWQVLPFRPDLARESIEVLAAYQGTEANTFRAEEAGKIMHELRLGELARLGQIPHSPYYGTVDATQLWIMLLVRYIEWTGDLEFAKQFWPRVKHALAYLDRATAAGYITYQRESPQ